MYLNLPNVSHEWDARDRGLAEGLAEYEAAIMSHGIPMWDALDDEVGTWLEAVPVVDYAQAAIEIAQKADSNPEPGTRWLVRDTRTYDPNVKPEATATVD